MVQICNDCKSTPPSYIYLGNIILCLWCNEKRFIKDFKKLQNKHCIFENPKIIEENIEKFEQRKSL